MIKKTSKKNMKKPKNNMKRQKLTIKEELICVIEVIRREKQETTSITKKERRHSRTRTNDHRFEGSNRRR
jgi:hypothetical protein